MAAKKKDAAARATFSVEIEVNRRADAPEGYVPPSPEQLEADIKALVDRTHGAYEATVTARREA